MGKNIEKIRKKHCPKSKKKGERRKMKEKIKQKRARYEIAELELIEFSARDLLEDSNESPDLDPQGLDDSLSPW